jgi:hypothetical protein
MRAFAIIVAFLAAVVIASPSGTDNNVVATQQLQQLKQRQHNRQARQEEQNDVPQEQ